MNSSNLTARVEQSRSRTDTSGDMSTRYLRDNKFIISCPARSGSTMLVHLLRCNPHVVCHGEVFDTDKIGHLFGIYAAKRKSNPAWNGRLWEYRRKRPAAFLYDLVFDSQSRRVAGFKFKTDEAFDPRFDDISQLVRNDTDIKVIHLRRMNLLDQYVSHQVVLKQTGIMYIANDDEKPQIRPFSVDVPHVLRYIGDVVDKERRAEELYSKHRHIRVRYEDLTQEDHPIRDRLQTFLGLNPVPLESKTKKIIGRNSDLVLNRDEVIDALTRHGYSGRLAVEQARREGPPF